MIIKRLLIMVAVFGLVQVGGIGSSAASDTSTIKDCQLKVTSLNYRSKALQESRKPYNDKYVKQRQKWATRIAYASQWVPKDAKKASEQLYAYDALHKETNQEIDAQIKTYAGLEKTPLDCTAAKHNELVKKLAEVNGTPDGKTTSAAARINQKKTAETTFSNKQFKKATDKMIKKLHAEKRKHPKAKPDKLVVKDY